MDPAAVEGAASSCAVGSAVRTGVPVVLLGGWQVLDSDGNDVPLLRADTAAEAVAMAHDNVRLR